MSIPDQAVKEFKDIYFSEFGENLDEKTAHKKAARVLKFMKITYRPLLVAENQKGV